MISAPNRRLLSNGSKSLFLLLLAVFIFASCDLFKAIPDDDNIGKEDDLGEIQGPKQIDPETGEYTTVTTLNEKMDTIIWKVAPPERFKPITSDGQMVDVGDPQDNNNTTSTGNQRMALLLPFFANQNNSMNTSINENSVWALQYYGGAQLAMEQLETEGANLTVQVYDSKGSEKEVQRIISFEPGFRSADLIVGPYKSSNVRMVAEYAKQNQIPLVSPWSASSNITQDNPFYIQVNPSLTSHCEAITQHVMENYSADQVVLVAKNRQDEISRLQYFQDAKMTIQENPFDTTRFQEYIVRDESVDFNEMDVSPYLKADKTTVFIVPSYRDESFVYSFLRKLKIAKEDFTDVVVYGLPQWMQFERIIDFDLYEDLNVHVSSFFYTDGYDQEIRKFKNRFFELYGTAPNEEAYIGYEVTLYFGRLLQKHGSDFMEQLDLEEMKNLYTTFRFRRVIEGTPDMTNFRDIERYENKYVHILKFQDYYFQPAN